MDDIISLKIHRNHRHEIGSYFYVTLNFINNNHAFYITKHRHRRRQL